MIFHFSKCYELLHKCKRSVELQRLKERGKAYITAKLNLTLYDRVSKSLTSHLSE